MIAHHKSIHEAIHAGDTLPAQLTLLELFPGETVSEYRIHRFGEGAEPVLQPPSAPTTSPLQHDLWIPATSRELFRFRVAKSTNARMVGFERLFDHVVNKCDEAPLTPSSASMATFNDESQGEQAIIVASRGIAVTNKDLLIPSLESYVVIAPETTIAGAITALQDNLENYNFIPGPTATSIVGFLATSAACGDPR